MLLALYRLPITKFNAERRKRRRRSPSNGTSHQSHHHDHHQAYDPFFGTAFADFDELDTDFFTSGFSSEKKQNGSNDVRSFDPMLNLPEDIYCSIVDNLDHACWEVNPVELWSYNGTEVDHLTKADIIHIFNTRLIRYFYVV